MAALVLGAPFSMCAAQSLPPQRAQAGEAPQRERVGGPPEGTGVDPRGRWHQWQGDLPGAPRPPEFSRHAEELESIARELDANRQAGCATRLRRVAEELRANIGSGEMMIRIEGSPSNSFEYRESFIAIDDRVRNSRRELESIRQAVKTGKMDKELARSEQARVQGELDRAIESRGEFLEKLRSRSDRITKRFDEMLANLESGSAELPANRANEVRSQIGVLRELFGNLPADDDKLAARLRELHDSPKEFDLLFQRFPGHGPRTDWQRKRLESERKMLEGRMRMIEQEIEALRPGDELNLGWEPTAPQPPAAASRPLPPLPR